MSNGIIITQLATTLFGGLLGGPKGAARAFVCPSAACRPVVRIRKQ
ncbi:MAG: hypothetical protein H0X24_16515 [Ktedonobacterales bacterium]|nr:hypothetical protein [Ktedonobacterales bacterium]